MHVLNSRLHMLVGGMLALSLGVCLWSISAMIHQRQATRQAQVDLVKCQDLERVILRMRQQTTLVAGREMESQELGQRIDAAARQAGLSLASLESVYPQPPQRVGNLPYVQKSTALVLRKVDLRSLAAFLYNVTDSPGMSVRQLRLRVPHVDAPSTAWDVDATITCLIYAPADASPSRGD